MRQKQTEVLVVGAGPVGLWSALLLAESGVEVVLIDREARTTARSYACALHPATLRLLDRFGLAESVIERGRRVETIAFYDGPVRQGEIKMSLLGGEFPFVLILPQNALETLLEQRLRVGGVAVQWNHRFEGLTQDDETITATIEELEGTSTGYIVPHWETVVKDRSSLIAQFIIGTDGHNSMVRSRAGFEYQRVGDTESFAAFEFQAETAHSDELRVVLDDATTNVLWPLGEKRFRWTFQLTRPEVSVDFPQKERRAVHVDRPNIDEKIRQYVQKVAHQRAPWFNAEINRVDWCTEVTFERRLAAQFGRNRCWLAGDAAHQTGPVGVQSMNMGFHEADILASALRKILREASPPQVLEGYDQAARKVWHTLLAIDGGLKSRNPVNLWAAQRCNKILPCLPAYGRDLETLAGQFGLAPFEKS
jgi:2-polyprenyl-6-methoxyphenol hydroxylase-like FAD-dependent oxidoreductase